MGTRVVRGRGTNLLQIVGGGQVREAGGGAVVEEMGLAAAGVAAIRNNRHCGYVGGEI